MGGNWRLMAVMGLGLVAALCAALLMAAMRAGGGSGDEGTTVSVVVAARDLPAMTLLEKDSLTTAETPRGEIPAGAVRDATSLLGKVLKNPLVEGQPVTAASILTDDSGARLASSLPDGSRAVSVELESSSAMRGLVYPGSRVDVIVSYDRLHTSMRGPGLDSRTLLQNVMVLAVEHKTVFSANEETDEEDEQPTRTAQKKLMVTLMVDPDQARDLQAAREKGTLSLSLRNPLDESRVKDPEIAAKEEEEQDAGPGPGAGDNSWRTLVVRGGDAEVIRFDGPKRTPSGMVPPSSTGSSLDATTTRESVGSSAMGPDGESSEEYADVPTGPGVNEE